MKTKKKAKKKKGFTLIELLVVIAIIAILSVVVVLTLNPAEMLRRSRDSNRASDLSIIKTSLSLYLADVSSTFMGTSTYCYLGYTSGAAPTTVYEFASTSPESSGNVIAQLSSATTTPCQQWSSTAVASVAGFVASSSRAVAGVGLVGTGWIPVNLSNISSGAPIGQWPADPAYSVGAACTGPGCNSSAGHFYSYIPGASNNSYKLAAKMESALYSQGGSGDLESTDGGTDQDMYEQGTLLSL